MAGSPPAGGPGPVDAEDNTGSGAAGGGSAGRDSAGAAGGDGSDAVAVAGDGSRPVDGGPPPRSGWSRRSRWRRASLLLAVTAWTLTGLMLLLSIGMWRNDMVIDADPVRTTATVLTVSALSTGIEFVDDTGVSQRPPGGVLYPGGLVAGQQFVVEYAADDPTLARVAGRSAVNGLIMPLAVIVVSWLVAGPALWTLNRLDRRRGRGRQRRRSRSRNATPGR